MSKVTDKNRAIVLASGSPRRRRLVEKVGFEPHVIVSDVPEVRAAGETPEEYTRRLAHAKAEDVAGQLGDEASEPDWMLAADTIVVHDDDVLEKPENTAEAKRMLARLAGTEHRVDTSFCWWQRSTKASEVRTVSARVALRALDDDTIARYVATGEPFDKAGGYGVQDIASAFVRSIEGSYFTVVGLPICEVVEQLDAMGGLAGFPFRQSEDDVSR